MEEYIKISEVKEDILKLIIEVARAGWNKEIDETVIKALSLKYNIDIDFEELGLVINR